MKTVVNTVDLFCGLGGASTGLDWACRDLGLVNRELAVNHWPVAVSTFGLNHPGARVLNMDLSSVVPADVYRAKTIDLLWASPSCTHHSRAKGGKPRENQLRAQPELLFCWADQIPTRRVIVENVPEIVDWGPLGMDGRPMRSRRGASFSHWVAGWEARGYDVEWRILNCADFGDATTRRRFFLQAVKKGCGRIVWPEPTHARRPEPSLFGQTPEKWRGLRELLDLEDTGKSIFGRRRPLSMNTLKRIAEGVRRFCGVDFQMDMLGAGENDGCRVRSLDEPVPAQHAGGGRTAVVRPFVVELRQHKTVADIDEPLSTVTTSGNHHVLCTPFLFDYYKGEGAKTTAEPLPTQTTHARFGLVSPLILGQQGGAACRPASEPCPTIATAGAVRGIFPIQTEDGRLVDIRIRMLKPRELARAHSFPEDYEFTGTRAEQVKQIGNSVPVRTGRAVCLAALTA